MLSSSCTIPNNVLTDIFLECHRTSVSSKVQRESKHQYPAMWEYSPLNNLKFCQNIQKIKNMSPDY